MGLWRRVERAVWAGDVLRDYGALSEGKTGPVKHSVSAMLTHKGGRDRFIIRSGFRSFFAASVQFVELDREAALRLKEALDDAVKQMG